MIKSLTPSKSGYKKASAHSPQSANQYGLANCNPFSLYTETANGIVAASTGNTNFKRSSHVVCGRPFLVSKRNIGTSIIKMQVFGKKYFLNAVVFRFRALYKQLCKAFFLKPFNIAI